MVDIDPAKLPAKGLTPLDIVNAVNAQNLTLPSGTAKIGDTQYVVRTNATPVSHRRSQQHSGQDRQRRDGLRASDVGQVHDGWLVQQNVVREDGERSVLLSIIKNGNASTLAVVNGVQGRAQDAARRRAAGHEDRRTVRPVGVRARVDQGRGARGR